MKAKEYADVYARAENKRDAINEIACQFLIETGCIIRERKAKSVSAGMAVVKEQADKWKAMSRRMPGVVKEDGYIILVKNKFPELAPYI